MTVTDLRAAATEDRLRAILATAIYKPLSAMPTHAAAGVLYVDSEDRVLLVRPTYKPYWDLPGGIVEPGESPRAAARREVREELGCDVLPVGDLLVVDHLPPCDGRPASMRYVFGCWWSPPGDGVPFRLQREEIDAWAWCTPQEQLERQVHAPMLARRVAAARTALHRRHTVYLEAAHEVTR